MSNERGWSCHETLGLGINNVRPVVKMPIPKEVAERWEQEAKEKGMTLDEYLDIMFAEAEVRNQTPTSR
jgi:hypothetical protein